MTPIFQELHRWMATPHVWGVADCITVLADWVQVVTGTDPMADVRMTYFDAASCQRETGFMRDPVAVFDKYAAAAGLQRGNELRAGDIAVIRRRDMVDPWPVGGLWTGSAWACKGPHGVTTLAPKMVEVIAFWNVGYEA
ncbi:DUF6950 family protein [Profundibacter sp.]